MIVVVVLAAFGCKYRGCSSLTNAVWRCLSAAEQHRPDIAGLRPYTPLIRCRNSYTARLEGAWEPLELWNPSAGA